MEIVNFGHFTSYSQGDGILYFKNEDGQDWYDLRFGLTTWDDKGTFIDAVYGAWAMVDPSTMCVTNVEFDPSRLMPGDRIVLGIDAEWTTIGKGQLYEDGVLKAVPPAPVVFPNISGRQLWLAAREIDIKKADVLALVEAMPDEAEADRLMIELTEPPLSGYERTSPAFTTLAAMMNIPESQFDALWLHAATL
jgi:hypothetical protein